MDASADSPARKKRRKQAAPVPGTLDLLQEQAPAAAASPPPEAATPAPGTRHTRTYRTVRTNGLLHEHTLQLIERLVEHLGRSEGDVPLVHINSCVGPVEIEYTESAKRLSFNILSESLRITYKRNHRDKLIAPSVFEALLFLTEVEAVRQCTQEPCIRFVSNGQYATARPHKSA
jgi:hypothetical protein